MFNYVLLVQDDKGNTVTKFNLALGASKKGTYATVSGLPANKVLPFGKIYVDEDKITTAEGKKPKKS